MAPPSATPVDDSHPDTRTRVDSAHAVDASIDPTAPSLELLQAVAGRDSQQAALQLRRQALQLAGLLRDKQRGLDQRESELNARTALLENEIRSSRLKQQQHALPAGELAPSDLEQRPTLAEALAGSGEDHPTTDEAELRLDTPLPAGETLGEGPRPREMQPSLKGSGTLETEPSSESIAANPTAEVEPLGAPPERGSPSDPLPIDPSTQQLRALRKQQAKLDSRQQHLEKLQEQVTSLHRESLELRLASEEIWAELMEHFSSEDLAQRLAETRNRLAEHYRLANESLAQRTDELHRSRQELHQQQQRFRGKRRELQLWVDRRYDEIQTRTSRLIMRERELDRLEAEFERQSMQWQQQREAYRQEIEKLTGQS